MENPITLCPTREWNPGPLAQQSRFRPLDQTLQTKTKHVSHKKKTPHSQQAPECQTADLNPIKHLHRHGPGHKSMFYGGLSVGSALTVRFVGQPIDGYFC